MRCFRATGLITLMLVASLALWPAHGGEIPFGKHVVNSNTDGPHHVAVVDLDDDGDQDIVATGFEADVVAWWENDGSENFTRANIVTGFVNPSCAVVIDLDDDGDNDVVASSFYQDKVSWLRNDGSESFTRVDIETGLNGANWVWAGDMDDDNDMDILVAVYHDDDLIWLENNGSESFTPHNVASTFDGASSAMVVDLDDDGDLDIIGSAQEGDRIGWWENNGSMSFDFQNIDNDVTGAVIVKALDMDGDFDLDLAATAFEADAVYWYENNGSEVFTRRTVDDNLVNPVGLAGGDLDGDLDVDLLSVSFFNDEVVWYENGGASAGFAVVTGPGPGPTNEPLVRTFTGDGTMISEFLAYGATGYGVNVACGDVDGDGVDEIITGAGPGAVYGPHVRGFELDGTPIPGISFFAYGTIRWGVNVACGDLDGDGWDEIITGAGPGAVFGPHIRGWDYDGNSTTPMSGVSFFAYGTPKWGVNVSAADFDGDGYDEILSGAGPGAVYGPHVRGWNVDGGTVSPVSGVSFLAYTTTKWGVRVDGGDVDGDGFDELITAPGPGPTFGAHILGWDVDGGTVQQLGGINFIAYVDSKYGARVGLCDMDLDGFAEILTGPGSDPNAPAHVLGWNYDGGPLEAITATDFYAYDEMTVFYGVVVAGGLFQ